jgi:dihydrofolate reductase
MKKIKLIIIAAVSVDGIIGVDDEIPWRIPEDFKHFRETTIGNVLIVGYNTFKTLPPKALEGRYYIVISSNAHPIESAKDNIFHFKEIKSVFNFIFDEQFDKDKVYVAGGAMLYDSLIDICDEAIITWINKEYPNGNKTFPINKLFTNFECCNDQEWQNSVSGLQYKITYYKNKCHE